MTMQVVPLQAVPNQTVAINLSNQAIILNVYDKQGSLYVDVFVSNAPIVVGVVAKYANKIVRDAYLGFIGDFAFFDLVGEDDPTYDQIGSRYFLAYLT